MAEESIAGSGYPEITTSAELWAFVETFAPVDAHWLEANSPDGTRDIFPAVCLPEFPMQPTVRTRSYFAVAGEEGKAPWLLVTLVPEDTGKEYRFRISAHEHGWANAVMIRGVFLIVRDADATEAFGIPCHKWGEHPETDLAAAGFEAAACNWLRSQGTHPQEGREANIVRDPEEINLFRMNFPLLNLGESLVETLPDGKRCEMPTVFVPDSIPLPAPPPDSDLSTMFRVCLGKNEEPILGIEVEIAGSETPFRFAVPGRALGWLFKASTQGYYCVQPDTFPGGREQIALTLPIPAPGVTPENDKVIAYFLKYSREWLARQRMN